MVISIIFFSSSSGINSNLNYREHPLATGETHLVRVRLIVSQPQISRHVQIFNAHPRSVILYIFSKFLL